MMRIEMQHLTHLRSRSWWRTAQGGMTTGGAAGWEVSSQVLKPSRRMSVCNAARSHVSVCVPIYRRYVQGYI